MIPNFALTNIKHRRPKILEKLYYLAAITISFDLFLVLNIGDFNFRFAQFILVFPILVSILNTLLTRRMTVPLGFKYLLIWFIFIFLFIPNTSYITRNIGYAFWLLFNILIVFSINQNIKSLISFIGLFRVYLYSFMIIALVGLIQFFMPLFGVTPPLVTQWWFTGLPRINGFSYEPSYYATYMILGLVITSHLRNAKSKIIGRKKLNVIYTLIVLALILSSSRMGWVIMILWGTKYLLFFMVGLSRGRVNTFYFKKIILTSSILLILLSAIHFSIGFDSLYFLLNGLGFNDTGAYSIFGRLDRLKETLDVFANSPFFGVSLGGVAPAIGYQNYITVTDQATAKIFEGSSVFAEVLAASGIFGVAPFILFLCTLIRKPLKLAKALEDKVIKNILHSLVYSLILILVILQFNQNILRPYLWFHIGMLTLAYSIGLKQRNQELLEVPENY